MVVKIAYGTGVERTVAVQFSKFLTCRNEIIKLLLYNAVNCWKPKIAQKEMAATGALREQKYSRPIDRS